MPKSLTAQQQKVLRFIDRFSRENGFPPTLKEIGSALDLANVNAVRGHLEALEKKGRIARVPDKARSIQLVKPPSRLSRLKRKLHRALRTDKGVIHHVVFGLAWAARPGTPPIDDSAHQRLTEAIEREAAEHGWDILEQTVERESVAVVVKTWHNHSPASTVRRLKSATESALRSHFPEFKRRHLWAHGYAVTTDPEMLDDAVEQLLSDRAPAK